MCDAVLAFKSKNGNLYISQNECRRHDEIFEQKQLEQKIIKIIADIAIPHPLYNNFDYHRSFRDEQVGAERAVNNLVKSWPLLLQKLKEIQ